MFKNKIESLIEIIKGTEINELEVSSFWGAQKIRLRKNINVPINKTSEPILVNDAESPLAPENKSAESVTTDLPPSSVSEPSELILEGEKSNEVEVIAPLVGTFYQSAKPGSPPFVKEGDTIELGQIICIIEAMKIFNEIESEVSGKIVKIIPTDSSPVEYGQVLMLVEPS
jgi:acetyl-CoA carboxylase biotin carboxyl carrier protein